MKDNKPSSMQTNRKKNIITIIVHDKITLYAAAMCNPLN